MRPRSNIGKTLTELYGTGHFNPRSFDHRPRRSRRLYAWALGLFLLAMALATALGIYLFAGTPDSFTGERVALVLEGDANAAIGREQSYILRINNNEEVDLTDAEIFIGYANGYNPSSEEPSFNIVQAGEGEPPAANPNTWILGDIKKGESKIFPLRLRFNGQAGANLGLQFYLSFRPKGFSSSLSAKLEKTFTLGQPAVGFNIQGANAVSQGSEATFIIGIDKTDGSGLDAADWFLSVNYPDSFRLIGVEPKQLGSGPYRVGDLPSSAGMYRLTIRGTIAGQAGDKIKLNAELKQSQTGAIIRQEKEIIIQSAAAAITLTASPAAGKKLQWNEELNYKITISNIGRESITDSSLAVILRGEDYWRSDSLQIGQKGFFEGGTIIWDKNSTPDLSEIKPNESRTFTFSLAARTAPPANLSGPPLFSAQATWRGKIGVEEMIAQSEENKIAILANIELDSTGGFISGPNPPLPGQETVYRIVWTLGPTSSELKNVSWSAVLPKGDEWRNQADYSLGELKYDESGRKVEWRASKITKLGEPIKISFQIAAAPGAEVTNQTVIFGQTAFTATDGLAGETLDLFTTAVRVGDIK